MPLTKGRISGEFEASLVYKSRTDKAAQRNPVWGRKDFSSTQLFLSAEEGRFFSSTLKLLLGAVA